MTTSKAKAMCGAAKPALCEPQIPAPRPAPIIKVEKNPAANLRIRQIMSEAAARMGVNL
ncbi:hypothetical protein [Deinococcus sp. KSM4-11]|uniref:hypothetical protein n=1 Tax=Deinococcus sp. KSM4-11 TaxID=2568654 RepID=UPI001454CFD6|nr:hypothetical protein [Deinococcus sp. KSM4-11]